jgi:hypothetical protein
MCIINTEIQLFYVVYLSFGHLVWMNITSRNHTLALPAALCDAVSWSLCFFYGFDMVMKCVIVRFLRGKVFLSRPLPKKKISAWGSYTQFARRTIHQASWFQKYMRTIRKVTSGELLTRQATRKKVIAFKIYYILHLFLNVVTPGIEALVSGNKYFMPVSTKFAACEFTHRHSPSNPHYCRSDMISVSSSGR